MPAIPTPTTIATWNVNGIRARHAQVLDHVLASAPLAGAARSCAVLREFGTSDHAPVVARFDGV
jgi:exonuclease III